jgi:hypothetical protein
MGSRPEVRRANRPIATRLTRALARGDLCCTPRRSEGMRRRATLALSATALLATPAALATPVAIPPRGSRIMSADLRMLAGGSKTILSVPRVGHWTATCRPTDRVVAIRFRAARLLATSDVVISRSSGPPLGLHVSPGDIVVAEPPAEVLSQRWQIAPFAAAQVHVTAATVVARRVGKTQCAASVVAVIGPDQGATRTG